MLVKFKRRKKEEGRRKEEVRRKKEEGKVLRCLSFKLLICPNFCFGCYKS
ncbi:MAG: hypothetical protein F6K15_18575 [Okeania sp. SIO2B3]|nr:hypothetical protein [Okeania sp. SIO2B3]